MNTDTQSSYVEMTEKVCKLELLCAILRHQLDMKNELVSEMRANHVKTRESNVLLLNELSKRKNT